jgi:hypothetical protein
MGQLGLEKKELNSNCNNNLGGGEMKATKFGELGMGMGVVGLFYFKFYFLNKNILKI